MALTVDSLPVEILEQIFAYLPFTDVKNAAQVCRIWNQVLHGSLFQRRVRVELIDYFRHELTPLDRSFLSRCKHLSIVQKFDPVSESGEDSEVNQQEDTEAAQNIADILFASSELNSLNLFSRYRVLKSVIRNRLSELPHLKELDVSFCYDNDRCEEDSANVWQLRNDSLQCFKIELPYSVGHFELDAPNLKELHLSITCEMLLKLVERYSKQLEIAKLKLLDVESLDTIMTYSFPNLLELELSIYDDKELYYDYILTADRAKDSNQAKIFIQHVPLLKVFSVHSHVVFYKICPTLCSVRTNLEELQLHNMEIDANILINVLLVQPLKRLTILQGEIINDLPGLHIRMVGLNELKLINVLNNVLLDHNFCDLKSLELSHGVKFGNDLLQKVFHNFTTVEELQIHVRTKLDKDALQKLHQLKCLKSLMLRATEITSEHWNSCQPMAWVEQFSIVNCFMLRFSMFTALRRAFPALKRLYVDRCHIIDDTSEVDAAIDGSCERKLRQIFDDCIVSWHGSVQVTPITLRRLLM